MKKIFVIASMSLFLLAVAAPVAIATPSNNDNAVTQMDDKEKTEAKKSEKKSEKKSCGEKKESAEKKEKSCS